MRGNIRRWAFREGGGGGAFALEPVFRTVLQSRQTAVTDPRVRRSIFDIYYNIHIFV